MKAHNHSQKHVEPIIILNHHLLDDIFSSKTILHFSKFMAVLVEMSIPYRGMYCINLITAISFL